MLHIFSNLLHKLIYASCFDLLYINVYHMSQLNLPNSFLFIFPLNLFLFPYLFSDIAEEGYDFRQTS